MKNSRCSKCQSDQVLEVPGNVGAFGAGSNLPIGWRAMNAVRLARFVCAACGFTESWVTDPADLVKVRNKYGESRAPKKL